MVSAKIVGDGGNSKIDMKLGKRGEEYQFFKRDTLF